MSPAVSAVVLAPHADDESIGCGGTLLRLHKAAVEITVVLLTRPEPFEIRRQEHAAATALLGVARVEELGYPEQALPEDPDAVALLYRLFCELGPALVLAPHANEMDRDHRTANRLARAALEMLVACGGEPPTLWEYEIWTALSQPTLVVDVTAVAEAKRSAILAYASQLARHDHVAGALGLNAYRACTLGSGRGFAEAFMAPALRGARKEAACIPLG
jgi:N-acetylglucosamine malate deacetylase 1